MRAFHNCINHQKILKIDVAMAIFVPRYWGESGQIYPPNKTLPSFLPAKTLKLSRQSFSRNSAKRSELREKLTRIFARQFSRKNSVNAKNGQKWPKTVLFDLQTVFTTMVKFFRENEKYHGIRVRTFYTVAWMDFGFSNFLGAHNRSEGQIFC